MLANRKFIERLSFDQQYVGQYIEDCENATDLEITLGAMLHDMALGQVPDTPQDIAPLYLQLARKIVANREEVLKLLSGSGPAPSP